MLPGFRVGSKCHARYFRKKMKKIDSLSSSKKLIKFIECYMYICYILFLNIYKKDNEILVSADIQNKKINEDHYYTPKCFKYAVSQHKGDLHSIFKIFGFCSI